MGSTGYGYQTLADAKWVSSKFEMVRRITILEWGHHQAVAALDPVIADGLRTPNGLPVNLNFRVDTKI